MKLQLKSNESIWATIQNRNKEKFYIIYDLIKDSYTLKKKGEWGYFDIASSDDPVHLLKYIER